MPKTATPSPAKAVGIELEMNVKLTIKPGKKQTPEEAAAEFAVLFSQYLTNTDGAFVADYGPHPWGGYEGPTVKTISVTDPTGTAVSVTLN